VYLYFWYIIKLLFLANEIERTCKTTKATQVVCRETKGQPHDYGAQNEGGAIISLPQSQQPNGGQAFGNEH